MRVIAGTARGRRLRAPPGLDTRPMMDRVKEAVFSSLGTRVPDARVLDLYAGSGALGIEALSRGAASVTFVERGRGAIEVLRSNLAALDFEGQVVAADVDSFLRGAEESYDLVFVDPPYRLSLALVDEVLAGTAALLANGGVMVVHRQAGEEAPGAPAGTRRIDDRRYGRTQLWIYERDES
ncbi:MAG: 16S rRNA (guanine(966)-N(2))-methyltransferase RsmD [Acidimicrobiia bacterium]|nr:16S rRNA (guanine(966)-N(2))-methyltransferase RsmD [Acidimicrobiia bacterium]